MTKIIIVRHGRTDYNVAWKFDCIWIAELNDTGLKQSKELIDVFKDEKITAIYSSPLQRCVDTITPLWESLGLEISQKQAFMEIKSIFLQDTVFNCKKFKYENDYGKWEKIIEVDHRVRAEMKKIIERHAWETIVICAHWDTTFLARNYFHNFDYDTEKYSSGLYLENNPGKWDIHAMYGVETIK